MKKLLYAHRGASYARPENTLEGFDYAIKCGADVIETDVHMTHDGHIVIIHDYDGKRVAKEKTLISTTTLSELKKWNVGKYKGTSEHFKIPSLKEALNEFPNHMFNVDIKPGDMRVAYRTIATIEECKAVDRVQVMSFNRKIIERVRKIYNGQTVLSMDEVLYFYLEKYTSLIKRVPRTGLIQVPKKWKNTFSFDTDDFVKHCHSNGYRVDYWVVNAVSEMQELFNIGANGIMTDDIEIIGPAFKALSSTK